MDIRYITKEDQNRFNYKIIIEPVVDELGKEYIAYSEELGKYSCFGKGLTPQEALKSYLIEKDEFIELLKNRELNHDFIRADPEHKKENETKEIDELGELINELEKDIECQQFEN